MPLAAHDSNVSCHGLCLLCRASRTTLHAMLKRRTVPCRFSKWIVSLTLVIGLAPWDADAQEPWVTYGGGDGPGQGKHIVFVTGEESYRSEESMPMMARILSKHHGFKCTVLFAIDPADGTINPQVKDNIPGLQALGSAD